MRRLNMKCIGLIASSLLLLLLLHSSAEAAQQRITTTRAKRKLRGNGKRNLSSGSGKGGKGKGGVFPHEMIKTIEAVEAMNQEVRKYGKSTGRSGSGKGKGGGSGSGTPSEYNDNQNFAGGYDGYPTANPGAGGGTSSGGSSVVGGSDPSTGTGDSDNDNIPSSGATDEELSSPSTGENVPSSGTTTEELSSTTDANIPSSPLDVIIDSVVAVNNNNNGDTGIEGEQDSSVNNGADSTANDADVAGTPPSPDDVSGTGDSNGDTNEDTLDSASTINDAAQDAVGESTSSTDGDNFFDSSATEEDQEKEVSTDEINLDEEDDTNAIGYDSDVIGSTVSVNNNEQEDGGGNDQVVPHYEYGHTTTTNEYSTNGEEELSNGTGKSALGSSMDDEDAADSDPSSEFNDSQGNDQGNNDPQVNHVTTEYSTLIINGEQQSHQGVDKHEEEGSFFDSMNVSDGNNEEEGNGKGKKPAKEKEREDSYVDSLHESDGYGSEEEMGTEPSEHGSQEEIGTDSMNDWGGKKENGEGKGKRPAKDKEQEDSYVDMLHESDSTSGYGSQEEMGTDYGSPSEHDQGGKGTDKGSSGDDQGYGSQGESGTDNGLPSGHGSQEEPSTGGGFFGDDQDLGVSSSAPDLADESDSMLVSPSEAQDEDGSYVGNNQEYDDMGPIDGDDLSIEDKDIPSDADGGMYDGENSQLPSTNNESSNPTSEDDNVLPSDSSNGDETDAETEGGDESANGSESIGSIGTNEDDIKLLDMPQGLVVSLFLSEADIRRLQTNVRNQGQFQFVLDDIGETKEDLQNILARHLNDDLVGAIRGLKFVSIERISAFLEEKTYNGTPARAIVVSSIKGTASYQGIESPSSSIFEANTLGAFNNKDSKSIILSSLQDSDDRMLARTVDIRAEINRGAISPTYDSQGTAVAATQSDTPLKAGVSSGDAAKTSGIAIGGVIIIIALLLVGRKIIRKSSSHDEVISAEGSDALDEKYDLSSIASETAFESTLVSNESVERSIVEHNRSIVLYDVHNASPQALSSVEEEEIEKKQVVRSALSFGPSSITHTTLQRGIRKGKEQMTASAILGNPAYDLTLVNGYLVPPKSGSSDDETAKPDPPPSDSILLLEDGLARNTSLNKSTDTNRAVMSNQGQGQDQDYEDVSVPSTVDLDEIKPSDAAARLGLGIRSFSDIKESEDDELSAVKSSPMPVDTPTKNVRTSPSISTGGDPLEIVRYSEANSVSSVSRVSVPTNASGGDTNHQVEENHDNEEAGNADAVIYDPILVGGRVQMMARSPIIRK